MEPILGEAYTMWTPLVDRNNPNAFKVNPTIAAGDFKLYRGAVLVGNLATLPVVEPAGGLRVKIVITAGEMTDDLQVVGVDVAGDEWNPVFLPVYTRDRTYQAKISVTDDDAGAADRYQLHWHRDGVPLSTGITSPTIQIVKIADGTNLIAPAVMTQVGSTMFFRYVESTNRIIAGTGYGAIASATIGGAVRTFGQAISRDSA